MECTLASLARVDLADPIATQALLNGCMSVLLDPALWLWAIGFTLACGLVGALIGWRRDGRWIAGLVWGLVLGPLGLLVIAFGASRTLTATPATSRKPVDPD